VASSRLADRAALKILTISRGLRTPPSEADTEPQLVVMPAPQVGQIGSQAPAPDAALPGLGDSQADMGTILQGGDMFDAITKGL